MSWLTYIHTQKNENVLPLLTNSLQNPPKKILHLIKYNYLEAKSQSHQQTSEDSEMNKILLTYYNRR